MNCTSRKKLNSNISGRWPSKSLIIILSARNEIFRESETRFERIYGETSRNHKRRIIQGDATLTSHVKVTPNGN